MRRMGALEVRAKFGEVIDAAAAGERIVIERAGQPVAAIVPLEDVERFDPAKRRERQLEASERIRRRTARLRRLGLIDDSMDAATAVRLDRDRDGTA